MYETAGSIRWRNLRPPRPASRGQSLFRSKTVNTGQRDFAAANNIAAARTWPCFSSSGPTMKPGVLRFFVLRKRGLLLMLHGDGNGTIGGEPHLVAFDFRDQTAVNKMMVSLV